MRDPSVMRSHERIRDVKKGDPTNKYPWTRLYRGDILSIPMSAMD
jgi:N-acetyl-anhydromuramyl-L-alanine amidase AmpD